MTITIPAELVSPMRSGAFLDLHYQVEEAGALVEPREGDVGAGVTRALARANGARALLDVTGWVEPEGSARAVDVDPHEHEEALLGALHLRIHAEWAVEDDELASAEQRATAKARAGQLANLSQQVKEGLGVMPTHRPDPLQEDGTQYLVVLQVLRDDHPEPWTRTELDGKLHDVDREAIGVALEYLREQGVVQVKGERFSASPCARHLDALGFIGI